MKTLTALATAIAAAPLAAQPTTFPVQPISGTILDISAQGEVQRRPDIALITAGVVTQATEARSAMQENATRMDRVIAALKRAGIDERDIRTASISLSPQYRYADNQPPVITGYQASNTLTIRFRDIARAGAVLDALVQTGANQINGPQLTLDHPEAAMDEARLDAMAQARSRAELYAKAAGMRVKRILSISEASYEMPRPMPVMRQAMDMASAVPQSKVMAGEQPVSASLSVRFELE